jgi:hypothetical protein
MKKTEKEKEGGEESGTVRYKSKSKEKVSKSQGRGKQC